MRQGEIWLVKISDTVGHEYSKDRPVLIIQSNVRIKKSKVCTVMPLTSNVYNCIPEDILIISDKKNNLYCNSLLKVYHITSFDHSRFIKRIGIVDKKILDKVKKYIEKHFGL